MFVDLHQDVWSRMSGGDGAPGWTFEAVGLDFTKFHAAGAAHVMQYKYDYARGGWQEDRYPQMTWFSNSHLPATAIMWTLFFAGRDMAPGLTIDGRNVQDYLQGHYAGAMRAVAERVKDQKHVLGFDTLNEPGSGYIGQKLTISPCGALAGKSRTPATGHCAESAGRNPDRARSFAHRAVSCLGFRNAEHAPNERSDAQCERRFDLARRRRMSLRTGRRL